MLANTFCLELIDCINLAFQTEALIDVFTGAILAIYYSNRSHCLRTALSVLAVYNMAPDMFMFRAMSIRQQNNKINAIN